MGTNLHSYRLESLNPDTVFETRKYSNGRTEFIFNASQLSDPDLSENIRSCAKNGLHPKGCNSIAACADHDIAHLLFYKAGMEEDKEFVRHVEFFRRHPKYLLRFISRYPYRFLEDRQKFAQELLAECWASANNDRRAPKIHRFFANLLEKRLS